MVHPGGFEPPTARFVAEYSIQLSYGCIGEMLLETVNGASGRITRLRLALRAVAKATLSSLVLAINSQTLKQQYRCYLGEYGASGRIRTSDRSVRSRVLYPAELRMHQGTAFRNSKWCIREDYSAATARFVAEYSIQLSYGCIGIYYCTARYSYHFESNMK